MGAVRSVTSGGESDSGGSIFRSLRADTLLMLGNRLGAVVLTLVNSVVIARKLGPEGRGIVAVALSFVLILVQLGNLGIGTANPYFAARDPASVPRIVTNSLWLAGGLGTILIGVGVALKAWLPSTVHGVDWPTLLLALSAVPASLSCLFLQSVLLAQGRSFAYNGIDFAFSALAVCAVAVALLVFGLGVDAVVAITAARFWASGLFYLAVLKRPGSLRPDPQLLRGMARYAFRIYVANLLAFLVIRADLLMVNGYLGTKQAGLYSVAVALGDMLYILPTAVAVNLFARVAHGAATRSTTAGAFRSVALAYGVACGFAVALCSPAIHLLYGNAFAGSVSLFYWLAPGIFCLGMLNILAQYFAGRGFPLAAVLVWFAGLGMVIALNVTLLKADGTYIAALSSSIAYVVVLLLHMVMFARESGGYRMLLPTGRDVARMFEALHRGRASQP